VSAVNDQGGVKIMSNNVEGKVVVITGASSGLEEATALLLSAQRAIEVPGARRVDRLQSLADELNRSKACPVNEPLF